MKQFFAQRWFLIALFILLGVGIVGSEPLRPLAEMSLLRDVVVALVLFFMAWPLELRAMGRSLMKPGPPALAVFVTFGLLPCFAWLISQLASAEMAPGILVAAATPCTLASASVWTRRAGGNDSVSILVTIVTNLLCVVVTPLLLLLMTGQSVDTPDLSFARMTMKLGLLVLLPMAAAQATRLHPGIAAWASRQKPSLSVLAQCGILFMVFVGAIRTGQRLQGEAADVLLGGDFVGMLAAVLIIHLSMFWAGYRLAKLCRFSREDQIAVGFAGSQKTLMVGLLMAISLQVTILPMVCYHIGQLLVDTIIADRLRLATTP